MERLKILVVDDESRMRKNGRRWGDEEGRQCFSISRMISLQRDLRAFLRGREYKGRE